MSVRRHAVFSIVFLTVAALAACSASAPTPGDSDHSLAAAAAAIDGLPGITDADVSSSTEGTPNQVFLLARVTTDPDHAPDPGALLEYVLGQVWATTETRPTTTVRVELTITGRQLELEKLTGSLALPGVVDADNPYDSSVRIQVADLARAFGGWPGTVPNRPESLIGSGE
jgi:hypothetical protein